MIFTHNFIETPIVTMDESSGSRRYITPHGNSYESVTKYIGDRWNKDFLVKWKKRIGDKKAASESLRATERGTYVHKTLEYYLLNDELNYRKVLNGDVFNKKLFIQIKPHLDKINNIRLIEKSLYSDELQLAGTPDVVAEYDGILSTIDLKTSGKDKLEEWITSYWLQVSIYSKMYEELFGVMPVQSVIIMAVEESPAPLVFIESSFKGQQRLQSFIEDPVKFQKLLKK